MAKHHRFLLFYGERSANNYSPQATTTALTASSTRTIRSQTPTATPTASSEQTIKCRGEHRSSATHKCPPPHLQRVVRERPPPTICGDEQIRYCRICGRGLSPQSRLRDEKRSEHLMRKSRFSKTPSETAVAFLLFSLSVWFLLFLLLRKKKQEK